MVASMSTRSATKRRRNSSATKPIPKRRKVTGSFKELSFTDDEGDTVVFRLSERNDTKTLSEHVNGKPTLKNVTKLMINEQTGRVVDDDGVKDCFRLKELDRLPELRILAEEAGIEFASVRSASIEEAVLKGIWGVHKDTPEKPLYRAEINVDWVGKKADVIEDPVKPDASKPAVVSPRKTPQEIWEGTPSKKPEESKPIEDPVKETVVKATTPKKASRGRSRSRSKTPKRSRSKSKTPKKKKSKTPRKPKVWDPITFEDTEGDKVTFTLTPEGYLQESVNGQVTLEKVTHLSLNTAISRIEDDDGKNDGFNVKDTELLGKLRDMAARAMDLNLYWSTEEPEPEAWCTVM